MSFFLSVMYAWLADNNISYALYGADGSKLDSWKASNLPDQFIPEEKEERFSPFPHWACYPISIMGDYCGCWCFLDDRWHATEIVRTVADLTEIACDMEENS